MKPQQSTLPGTIDVQAFIDNQRFSPYQWMVLIVCFLVVVADGFDTAAIGYVAPSVTREWGVSKLVLGNVLSASLVGLALGALIAGPCADRFGRKAVLLVSVAVFGLFSLATASAQSAAELSGWRFLTGLGLGAAIPNATTLLAEYAPARRRAFLVNSMFCGFTLGAAGGGFLAALIIPAWGWRSVFIVGGAAPLVLALLVLALPESIRFMVLRDWPADKIRAVLRRIAGSAEIQASRFTLPDDQADKLRSPLGLILSQRYRTGTLMLWTTYFLGVLVFYLVTSWMPTLVKEAGATVAEASLIAALFPLGGTLGAIACGWLMDRIDPHRVIGVAYFFTAVFTLAMGQATSGAYLTMLTPIAGLFMGAGLVSMPALAASFYPTHGRACGVGWMLGIGRFGGILGAVAGGTLLQLGLGMSAILSILAVPALFAAVAVAYKGWAGAAEPAQQTGVASEA
ncbi:MFS transporter [Cupriavidus necator]|uniref:MFS transporter n=1 Tax=Cupriavidus necator TaxID=106590 RepID=UPI0005B47B5E|nr:MFS transporter [Cupriavidus necator]